MFAARGAALARALTAAVPGGRARLVALIALALIVSTTPSLPAQPGPPEAISDQETIFAELGPDGSVERTISVDWLRVTADGLVRIVDSAPGADPRTLAGTPTPRQEDGTLVWELEVDGTADLFMTAEPSSTLPMTLELRYFVDGRRTPPENAQGAAGRVRVEGVFRNVTDPYVPLVANVAFSLPVASFRSLDRGSATAVAVGRRVQLAYVLTPKPEASFAFEIQTGRAQLPRYTVTLLPQSLEAAPLLSALGQLQESLGQLRSAGSLRNLQAGASGLGSGAGLGISGARGIQAGLTPPSLDEVGRKLVAGLPPRKRAAAMSATRQARASAEEKTRKLAAALEQGVGAVRSEIDKFKPPPEIARLLPTPGSSALNLEQALSSLGGLGQAGAGLSDLIAGLARIQSAAAQLQSALSSLDTEGFEETLAELEGAGQGLPTEEELARAQAYDTFTGKPEGASGQVRFVYQVAEPVKPSPPPAAEEAAPEQRPLWRRILGLIPGID